MRARAKIKQHGKASKDEAAKPPNMKRSLKNPMPSRLSGLSGNSSMMKTSRGEREGKPNEIHLDNLEKAKRALDEFDKDGKPKDKGKSMV